MISDIDINKIEVSNKLPFDKQDFKYLTGYNDSEKNRLLCLIRPQMVLCNRNFDENKLIYFLTKEEKVLIKYMEILEKVSNIIKKQI